jgi:hypothetical protein
MELTCEEARKYLKDCAEHRLEPPLLGRVEQHIFDCYDCLLCYVAETQWEPDAHKIPA